ncbi:MAG TPA: tyrosine-type recombinase/integrase [Gemmatimonadaceae bacterium]|jgi:integrase|nr:tyrosine-type recombinase/integrase [Gemmatimonadaceae bacterium]
MSALARQLEDYLRLRRMLGHKLDDAARQLPWFVEHLDATGHDYVTTAAALAWALDRNWPAGSTVPGHRMMAVRGFARYLAGIDPRTEVPPPGLVRIPRSWRPPFIYTDDDVLALMDAARRSLRERLSSATYETLFGLLATTGLRVGEALRLDQADVNVTDALLVVRRSKFGKSRQVPLQPSAMEALERYQHRRLKLYPHPATDSLFVSLRGTRVIYASVWKTFRRLCEQARIGEGAPITPTVHDFRHSFAVRTLLDWYRAGVDVQSRLAWLSTYLGHGEPRYTYHYLSAAPELLAHAARLLDDAKARP